ncbi:MAG: hypothetical protein ACREV9_11090 [Burkholderiales bacterium]
MPGSRISRRVTSCGAGSATTGQCRHRCLQPGCPPQPVTITVEPGQIIAPPPDGASYLGFIFARAASPADAEAALRIAHRRLHFDIRPEYPAMEAPAAERT